MKTKRRQFGLSLTEMAVVIATIALLIAVGVPAVRAFINSFETGSSTKSMISAALSNARAIAAKEQKYAGVRFQKAYQPEGPLNAPQYMVFIVLEEPAKMGDLTIGFRAVKGIKPIRLPDTVGVMDYGHIQEKIKATPAWEFSSNPAELTDLTTFSIIFSPSGKLIIHDVRVRNRDGKIESTETPDISRDDIFNTLTKITDTANPVGMFLQDDYFENPLNLGLGPEPSRNSFIIYEQKDFKRAYENGQAWSGYLKGLEPFYINAYMGTIIE